MLHDANNLVNGFELKTDICIVGAGAAGITLAQEFAKQQKISVCVLESGGMEFDETVQDFCKGSNIGRPTIDPYIDRERLLGGTTNKWGGAGRPLDEIDFQKRDWVPYSGWPFHKEHLDPFYERAHRLCEIGNDHYDLEVWKTNPQTPKFPFDNEWITTKTLQHVPDDKLKFGLAFLKELKTAKNIHVYLHANLFEIETTENAREVKQLHVKNLKYGSFMVRARFVVLALGGIENPRIMLLSNKIQKAGLGNEHDHVGRFFMEHPHHLSGIFKPSKHLETYALYHDHFFSAGGTKMTATLAATEKLMRQHQLLNYSAFLVPTTETGALYMTEFPNSKGILASKELKSILKKGKLPERFGTHLHDFMTDIGTINKFVYTKFLSMAKSNDERVYVVFNITEQAPNPSSRIMLGDEKDALGQRRVVIDWRLTTQDRVSMKRAQETISQQLIHLGLGKIEIQFNDQDNDLPPTVSGGKHHMGTTRMHENAKEGVVDANSRVHGILNLYIAGSSVFPTSGFANPTLTLIALSLRLADHLIQKCAQPEAQEVSSACR